MSQVRPVWPWPTFFPENSMALCKIFGPVIERRIYHWRLEHGECWPLCFRLALRSLTVVLDFYHMSTYSLSLQAQDLLFETPIEELVSLKWMEYGYLGFTFLSITNLIYVVLLTTVVFYRPLKLSECRNASSNTSSVAELTAGCPYVKRSFLVCTGWFFHSSCLGFNSVLEVQKRENAAKMAVKESRLEVSDWWMQRPNFSDTVGLVQIKALREMTR